jgi:hypothetical protein
MESLVTMPFVRYLQVFLVILSLSGNAQASFHLWQITQLYSNADGTVQYIELQALASGQQFLTGHGVTSTQGSSTHTYTFTQPLPGDTAVTTGGGGYYGGGMVTSYMTLLIGTQGFAALNVVTPDYIVPNGFLFSTNGTVTWGEGADAFSYASLPTDGRFALNRDGSMTTNAPMNFNGQMGTIVNLPVTGGGSSAKTLGSRATVTPALTLFGGFELTSASTVYILARGNSLGTLGVTQNFLDSPRVRLFNSQGQDMLTDAGTAGFTGCSAANAGTAVVNYYTNVRGQAPHARDGCTAQTLQAGVYTFTVTPSTTGTVSSPSSGEVLFEVTLGSGGGASSKTLGSRATVSPSTTLFGGFELAAASNVDILVRGNSLGTLNVTQSFLDSPRVRLFDSGGHDLIFESPGVAGFTGCANANSGGPVMTYYATVRGQATHARDGCTAQPLPAGVYTFTVTPSTSGTISSPASGEILFEVTLNP